MFGFMDYIGLNDEWVNSKTQASSLHWITKLNHSHKPNCLLKPIKVEHKEDEYKYSIGLYSSDNISKGDELTLNYKWYSNDVNVCKEAVCLCGEVNCKGTFIEYKSKEPHTIYVKQKHFFVQRLKALLEGTTMPCNDDEIKCIKELGIDIELLNNFGDWATKYVAYLAQYIIEENKELPSKLYEHVHRNYAQVTYKMDDAKIDADEVKENRIKALSITMNRVKHYLREQERMFKEKCNEKLKQDSDCSPSINIIEPVSKSKKIKSESVLSKSETVLSNEDSKESTQECKYRCQYCNQKCTSTQSLGGHVKNCLVRRQKCGIKKTQPRWLRELNIGFHTGKRNNDNNENSNNVNDTETDINDDNDNNNSTNNNNNHSDNNSHNNNTNDDNSIEIDNNDTSIDLEEESDTKTSEESSDDDLDKDFLLDTNEIVYLPEMNALDGDNNEAKIKPYMIQLSKPNACSFVPPIKFAELDEIIDRLWNDEDSLIQRLLRILSQNLSMNLYSIILGIVENTGIVEYTQNGLTLVRKQLIYVSKVLNQFKTSRVNRHHAAADLLLLYANTQKFFKSQPFSGFESSFSEVGVLIEKKLNPKIDIKPKTRSSRRNSSKETSSRILRKSTRVNTTKTLASPVHRKGSVHRVSPNLTPSVPKLNLLPRMEDNKENVSKKTPSMTPTPDSSKIEPKKVDEKRYYYDANFAWITLLGWHHHYNLDSSYVNGYNINKNIYNEYFENIGGIILLPDIESCYDINCKGLYKHTHRQYLQKCLINKTSFMNINHTNDYEIKQMHSCAVPQYTFQCKIGLYGSPILDDYLGCNNISHVINAFNQQ